MRFGRTLFLTVAPVTPGVVEPAADVDVVVPERWSDDEDESAAAAAAEEAEAAFALRRL